MQLTNEDTTLDILKTLTNETHQFDFLKKLSKEEVWSLIFLTTLVMNFEDLEELSNN